MQRENTRQNIQPKANAAEKRKKTILVAGALLVTVLIFSLLIHQSFFSVKANETAFVAMGTAGNIKIYSDDYQGITSEILAEINSVEIASSAEIKDSAVNALNVTGETTDKYLLEQLEVCQDIFLSSGGAFDYTVGSLTSLWRIGFEDAKKPSQEEIDGALKLVGAEKCTIGKEKATLYQGQKVDLGAIGKGYACDKAKDVLEKSSCKSAVISVGGSLLFYGKNPNGESWRVAVRNPMGAGYAGTFMLKEGFVSTSGSYERFLEVDNIKYHHILDSKTGYPAKSELVSVTVIASSGALSDGLSTACFVLGFEDGAALLNKYDARGIFIFSSGTVKTVGVDSFVIESDGLHF